MVVIVFFSKNEALSLQIEESMEKNVMVDHEFVVESDPKNALRFLQYQMPQFAIFDLDDPEFSNNKIFQAILDDPWINNNAIFGITGEKQNHEKFKFPFVYTFTHYEIETQMPRILVVLMKNENLLFRSGIIQDMGEKGIFVIQSDLNDVKAYAELIASNLYNRGFIQIQKKFGILFAMNEMLINAIEHGNCEITSEEKNEWINAGNHISDLIALKRQDPKIANRTITLEYELKEKEVILKITDKGNGFDAQKHLAADQSKLTAVSGRGIYMTKNFIDSISYNDKGNQVILTFSYDKGDFKNLPIGFNLNKTIHLAPGETLFKKGDKSDGLFYIINGEFEAWVDGKLVSILDNSDVFLGEMAFLLGHKRTATVKARTESVVVFIGTEEWVDTLRKFPLYGIYLAKILARKLHDTSITVSTLKQI